MIINNLKWDLDAILEGGTLDELYKKWYKQRTHLMNIYQDFIKDEKHFIDWLEQLETMTKLSNRIMNYISNNSNEDLTNPEWQGWAQKISNDNVEYAKLLSNYENIILDNKSKVQGYLKNPKIKEYQRAFDNIFKFKPHTLSEKEEKLISQLSRYNGGFEEIFSSLTDSDISYEDAKTKNGEAVKLTTMAEVFKQLKSHDREVRKTTWINFNKEFYKYRNTLTQSLYYNYLMLNTNAKIRNFKDYIDETAFGDEIKPELITFIYDQVATYKSMAEEYRLYRTKILESILDIKQLEPWDKNIDLVKKDIKFTVDEAKAIAKEALLPLGKDYVENIQRVFDERWISWMPTPTKQTGGYSIGGTKGLSKYYISMNFNGTIQSIFTLVHELGHSMHSYNFGKSQKLYQSCSIFYAEIASITNEMLLNHYLLNKYEDDSEVKLMILDEIISGFSNTTSRQIIFSNFEYEANKLVNDGSPFTYEKLQDIHLDMIEKYIGLDKPREVLLKQPYVTGLAMPLRVSHFYVGNFYVYKYAIGQIAAIVISDRIMKGDKEALKNYYEFLKSGSSKSPMDTIALLGIDLSKPEVWQEAKKIMTKYLDQFKKIVKNRTNA